MTELLEVGEQNLKSAWIIEVCTEVFGRIFQGSMNEGAMPLLRYLNVFTLQKHECTCAPALLKVFDK